MKQKYHKYRPISHRQFGITLIELMVALALGLLLMAGILQIFIGSKTIHRVQEGLSRLQEDGRFVVEYLGRDLRMAGYMGCISRLALDRMTNNIDTSGPGYSDFLHDLTVAVQGYEATGTNAWSPTLNSTISGLSTPPMDGTDVLVVRRAIGELPVMPPYMPTVAANVKTVGSPSDPNPLQKGDFVVISDCDQSVAFQITNTNPSTTGTVVHNTGVSGVSPGNATKDFPKTFEDNSWIFLPAVKTFYIATGASGQSALWEYINSDPTGGNNPREVVEGVENIQVLYGEDTDGNEAADVYVTANNVTDWNDVVAIRVSLLLQTVEDNLAAEPQPYPYNGATVTPADRRLRRVFTLTVGIRNRIP